FEGVRRFDWNWNADHSLDDDHLAVAVDDETYGEALQVHAAAYFEYDTNHRIRTALFNGSCGCGGGSSNGELHFTYGTLGTPDPAGGHLEKGVSDSDAGCRRRTGDDVRVQRALAVYGPRGRGGRDHTADRRRCEQRLGCCGVDEGALPQGRPRRFRTASLRR